MRERGEADEEGGPSQGPSPPGMEAGSSSLVALARCPDYLPETVSAALAEVLRPFGGIAPFAAAGERLALKPNLLLAAPPERAITTHPALVEAVAAEVRLAGAYPYVVESPGAGIAHGLGGLDRVFRRTGMAAMSRRTGLELSQEPGVQAVSHPRGKVLKRVDLLSALLAADGLVSLPKLKTHTYMTFTGAVKNLFGGVPGLHKAGYHAKLPEPRLFADMLLDVLEAVGPRLHIMDAVLALEGDGPGTGGQPREVGLLLASPDPVALDAVASYLIGLMPERIPTLLAARERGLWTGRIEDIALAGLVEGRGEGLAELRVPGFLPPRQAPEPTGLMRSGRIVRVMTHVARQALNPRPRPRARRCNACRTCVRACPMGAIDISGSLARIEDERCIRCYCCHELCPEAAIDLEVSGLGRLIRALGLM